MQCSREKVSWSKWLIGLVVVFLSVVPLGLYFWVFGPLSGYRLSETDQSWANFGSFLGGTVGPLLSAFALCALAITIRQQNKQLDQQSEQLEQQNIQIAQSQKQPYLLQIQDLIAKTSESILFQYHMDINTQGLGTLEKKSTIFKMLLNKQFWILDQIPFELKKIERDTSFLCHCFDAYIDSGGSDEVCNLYRDRISAETIFHNKYKKIEDIDILKYFPFDEIEKLSQMQNGRK